MSPSDPPVWIVLSAIALLALGLWKLVDVVVWFFAHFHFYWS